MKFKLYEGRRTVPHTKKEMSAFKKEPEVEEPVIATDIATDAPPFVEVAAGDFDYILVSGAIDASIEVDGAGEMTPRLAYFNILYDKYFGIADFIYKKMVYLDFFTPTEDTYISKDTSEPLDFKAQLDDIATKENFTYRNFICPMKISIDYGLYIKNDSKVPELPEKILEGPDVVNWGHTSLEDIAEDNENIIFKNKYACKYDPSNLAPKCDLDWSLCSTVLDLFRKIRKTITRGDYE